MAVRFLSMMLLIVYFLAHFFGFIPPAQEGQDFLNRVLLLGILAVLFLGTNPPLILYSGKEETNDEPESSKNPQWVG